MTGHQGQDMYRLTAATLFAFSIGVLSDLFLIRNGLSYSGLTLLDRHPALWPIWLIFILICACLLSLLPRDSHTTGPARYLPHPAQSAKRLPPPDCRPNPCR